LDDKILRTQTAHIDIVMYLSYQTLCAFSELVRKRNKVKKVAHKLLVYVSTRSNVW